MDASRSTPSDIIAAQAQQYTDDPLRTSDILFELREKIPKEDSIWIVCVDNALANLFLRQAEWRLAMGALDRIVELIPAATDYEADHRFSHVPDRQKVVSVLTTAYRCEILSRQGRCLLQVGALPEVEQRFLSARTQWETMVESVNGFGKELSQHVMIRTMPALLAANDGLFYFAKSNYEKAMECFTRATDHLRSHGTLIAKYRVEDWMGPTVAGSEMHHVLFSECINNISLGFLYTCRMADSVMILESLVREDPTAFLTERVAFNLCTLYELGSDSAGSARRKRVLQLIAKRFFLHDIGPESFRLT